MRIIWVLFAASVLAVPSALAQHSRGITSTLDTTADGGLQLSLKNESRQPVAALVVVIRRYSLASGSTRSQTVRYIDCVVDKLYCTPLMSGDTRTFTAGAPDVGRGAEFVLKAALFENGDAFGDPAWIQRIISHRRMLFDYLGSVAAWLRSAMGTSMSRDDCLSKLSQLEATATGRAHSHEEDMAIRTAYEGAIVNLERDTRRDGTIIPLGERQRYILSQFWERRAALAHSRPTILRPGETVNPPE